MRVLFAGSPAIAVPAFEALCSTAEIDVVGALTNPDSPKGRSGNAQPTEVGTAAERISKVPIIKTLKLNEEIRGQVAELKPDLLVSFAYGKIFSAEFLALFPLGGINVHPSLLPKYRGPTPIQSAILNRDDETGITVQKLAKELDSGDILAQEKFQLTGDETTESLSEVMAKKAAIMLPKAIKAAADGEKGAPQNHAEVVFCSKITKEDGIIDWNKSAREIDARVRAFIPWPLCRTFHNEKELILLRTAVYNEEESAQGQPGLVLGIDKQTGILVQTGVGILALGELQYQAKKALGWKDFLNGARDFTGSRLG